MKKQIYSVFILSVLVCVVGFADQEVHPSPYMVASGRWYAKCFPKDYGKADSRWGADREAGETLIYQMGSSQGDADALLHRFNWYSPKIYLAYDDGELTVVRMGPWPRGGEPAKKDLAIAFYRGGVLAKRYSMFDLVGKNDSRVDLIRAKKLQVSASHYSVIERVVGFVQIHKAKTGDNTLYVPPAYGFEIVLHGAERVVFDLRTGRRIVLLAGETTSPAPWM